MRCVALVSSALLALTALASAQPGTVPATVAPTAGPNPGEVAPASVMDRRWAVSGGIGWEELSVKSDNVGDLRVTFAVLDVAGRFRIRRDVELGLGLVAGGAEGGDMSTGGLFLDGRYRFRAEKPWNVYLGLGLGVQSVGHKDATKEEKKGRGALRVAFGVERRYSALALFGEVRVVGIGENKDVPPLSDKPDWFQFTKYPLSGGHVTFGASYYF